MKQGVGHAAFDDSAFKLPEQHPNEGTALQCLGSVRLERNWRHVHSQNERSVYSKYQESEVKASI